MQLLRSVGPTGINQKVSQMSNEQPNYYHMTLNQRVAGSSPAAPTNDLRDLGSAHPERDGNCPSLFVTDVSQARPSGVSTSRARSRRSAAAERSDGSSCCSKSLSISRAHRSPLGPCHEWLLLAPNGVSSGQLESPLFRVALAKHRHGRNR